MKKLLTKAAKCYMCHEAATTREHVPPKSFFLDGHRTGLLVVPACAKHNNSNSKDVEYVRGVMSSSIHVNDAGLEMNQSKVKRSYDRSPGLLRQSFKDIVLVMFQGEETPAFDIDKDRFDSVISAIANGVYYYHHQHHYYGTWRILCPQFISTDPDLKKQTKAIEFQRKLDRELNAFQYVMIVNQNPSIFIAEAYAEDAHKVIFRFRFYGDLTIFAVGTPFYRTK